jgi:t-SNARE complex subunit (syntaxin)
MQLKDVFADVQEMIGIQAETIYQVEYNVDEAYTAVLAGKEQLDIADDRMKAKCGRNLWLFLCCISLFALVAFISLHTPKSSKR